MDTGVDILKRTFKDLKKKNANLETVIDTNCRDCCKNFAQEPIESIPGQEPSPHEFLSAPESWNVFTHPHYPGFYLIKGAFSGDGIRRLLGRVLLQYVTGRRRGGDGMKEGTKECEYQVRTNLSCLGETPNEGHSYWSAVDSRGDCLIDKLRWISMGYHYDWTAREYRPGFKSQFPAELAELAHLITKRLGICEDLRADATLVNFYHPGDTLAFHQDELEWDLSKPLVSISLGLPGILCVGGTNRSHPVLPLLLSHGDVIILSGDSRTAYHAVPRVFGTFSLSTCSHGTLVTHGTMVTHGSCCQDITMADASSGESFRGESAAGKDVMFGNEWVSSFVYDLSSEHCSFYHPLTMTAFQEKVSEFLSRTRINISIRQVEKHS